MVARRFAVVVAVLAAVSAQNSTRKERRPPSSLAERAGSAVPWRESLEVALAEAREQRKPVFWFVPTVAGSPMDRKPEIDRYLMAGPFSWPSTIELLATRFIPVKAAARGEAAKRYELARGTFIEPGWLVLDGDGKELGRLSQLTTFQPQWFEAPLRRLAGVADAGFVCGPALREAWQAYRAGDPAAALLAIDQVLAQTPADAVVAEALFLQGAVHRRDRRPTAATASWQALGERLPASTWAWKAAMEVEGHGPFVHGFEDYLPVPERTLRELDVGSRAPAGTYTEPQLWQLGVQFLLRMADDDGVLRDSIYDFGGTDSMPNVHAAVTFLAGEALLLAAHRVERKQLTLLPAQGERVERQLEALLAVAGDDGKFAVSDRDELLWAYAYRVRFLARWWQLRPGEREGLVPRLRSAIAAVVNLQPETGVWFHEYGNPFAIATALQALAAARDTGSAVDATCVDRGVRALLQCRTERGAYSYGHPGKGAARATIEAAAGRMPLCELALLQWGKADQATLQAALTAAFQHHGLLAAVRKYDDHADQHGYGGFFFWFDMLARTEATMQVGDATQRARWQGEQRQLVLDLPEFDGCFVDSHELGRTYGTAMALLCLAVLDP